MPQIMGNLSMTQQNQPQGHDDLRRMAGLDQISGKTITHIIVDELAGLGDLGKLEAGTIHVPPPMEGASWFMPLEEGQGVHAFINTSPEVEALGPVQGARPGRQAADTLREMAATAEQRNSVYKDNWRMIGPMIEVLWPNGVPPALLTRNSFHLFMQILGKAARFASTDCTHIDSAHDIGPYAALLEIAVREETEGTTK